MKTQISLLAALLSLMSATAVRADIIEQNPATVFTIGNLGLSYTPTFGEVFNVPAGGYTQLNSFSFTTFGTVPELYAGVAAWTGTGAGPALFTSPIFGGDLSSLTGITIYTGGLNLTAGQQYVAYFSVAGFQYDNGYYEKFELGQGVGPIGVGAAWDNSSGGSPNHSPWLGAQGSPSTNFAYTMDFSQAVSSPPSSVPEPSSAALFGSALIVLVAVGRRKSRSS
jgi:hypothetical protein